MRSASFCAVLIDREALRAKAGASRASSGPSDYTIVAALQVSACRGGNLAGVPGLLAQDSGNACCSAGRVHPSRFHRVAAATLALAAAMTLSYPASVRSIEAAQTASTAQHTTAPRRSGAPSKAYEEFQVAAGNTLPIALRSRLVSSTSRASDHVEGRLLRPIVADGVELVPAGATVLGTVTQVEAAGPKKPGKLAFAFHVIEHPDTGSRAMIKASPVAFQSQPPAKGQVFADVVLEKGTDASVLLLAPLLVRLPIQ